MATNVTSDRVLNGSYGQLWLDGVLMAEVYGLDAQIEVLKQEVPMCGTSAGVGKRFTGWNGTGSLRFNKVSSQFAKKQAEAIKNGNQLVSTIISKLDDRPQQRATKGSSVTDRFLKTDCFLNTILRLRPQTLKPPPATAGYER